jgi:hypothetical protein
MGLEGIVSKRLGAHAIVPADRRIGSSSRIPTRQP